MGFLVGDGPGMSDEYPYDILIPCGAFVGVSVVTGGAGSTVGSAVGTFSTGDEEGLRVGSFVCGEMVGEPSGKAGQNAGHAPPRSGSYEDVIKKTKQS